MEQHQTPAPLILHESGQTNDVLSTNHELNKEETICVQTNAISNTIHEINKGEENHGSNLSEIDDKIKMNDGVVIQLENVSIED